MSGRYSYGIDNPPTLRRSSFPQRVVRPIGVPYCKTRSGIPRDPHARRAQPALQSGRPSATLRAALSAAVRPPLPTRSCDLAGIPQKPARWSAKGEPPPLSCPCRSNVALLRLLARIAPVAPQGIVAASATGGAPIPCPSKEGNYGGSGQILCSQPPPCRKSLLLFLASTCRQSAPHPPSPKGRGGFFRPKLSTNPQTRKLFMKVCANSTLSLQISLISSVLVRGLLIVNDK